jgi:hypothetical protein
MRALNGQKENHQKEKERKKKSGITFVFKDVKAKQNHGNYHQVSEYLKISKKKKKTRKPCEEKTVRSSES